MAETAEEIREHSKTYIKILIVLLFLTVLTVAVSYYDFGGSVFLAVFVGLLIATVKGSLVACYFMHLIDEQKIIYWVLGITVICFTILMVVPFLTDMNSVFNN